MRTGRLASIEDALKEIGKLDERNALTAYSVAGNIYMATGKYPEAEQVYDKLLEKDPSDLGALITWRAFLRSMLPSRTLARLWSMASGDSR